MIAVSTLLVMSFMAYANVLRFSSEAKQLADIVDHVAARSAELLTLAFVTNSTSEAYVQMPAAIGSKQYWLQLRNDSTRIWIEGGLGNVPVEGSEIHTFLPGKGGASGHYIGGYGAACIRCNSVASFVQIQLTNSSSGV
jgi:hypothetical protein